MANGKSLPAIAWRDDWPQGRMDPLDSENKILLASSVMPQPASSIPSDTERQTSPRDPSFRPMSRWGYAGVFPGAFVHRKDDPDWNRLEFCAREGFNSTHLSWKRLREDERFREEAAAYANRHGLSITPHPSVPWFAEDPALVRQAIAQHLEDLVVFRKWFRIPLVPFSVGPFHRFQKTPSLAWQMERLVLLVPELAATCREMGSPLGIENHCDYYLSDLLELCREVPGLGIFLDTGNCFMVGEKIWEAIEEVAPMVTGTHFKDHVVHPDPDILHFVVGGAILGEGHARLRYVYEKLIQLHPSPDTICFQVELVPPAGADPWDSLVRSRRFLDSLPTPADRDQSP